MRYFVWLVAALALVAGATKVGYDRFEQEIETRTSPHESAVTTTLPQQLPGQDQVLLVGTIAHAHLESALLDPLILPVTITTPQRGLSAGGTFDGVTIGGKSGSIHWDAGTPLKLSGSGALALGAVDLDVDTSTITIQMGEKPHGLSAGDYQISSPVAVQTGKSLATPQDSASFTAGGASTVAFVGGALTTFPVKAFTAKGPGKVVLNGAFTLVRPDGSQVYVTNVSFDTGPFDATFTPSANGVQAKVTLQGQYTAA